MKLQRTLAWPRSAPSDAPEVSVNEDLCPHTEWGAPNVNHPGAGRCAVHRKGTTLGLTSGTNASNRVRAPVSSLASTNRRATPCVHLELELENNYGISLELSFIEGKKCARCQLVQIGPFFLETSGDPGQKNRGTLLQLSLTFRLHHDVTSEEKCQC